MASGKTQVRNNKRCGSRKNREAAGEIVRGDNRISNIRIA